MTFALAYYPSNFPSL